MNTKLIPTILLCAAFFGCVTAPDGTRVPDVQRIAAGAYEAAKITTGEILLAKPELKPKFEAVRGKLAMLAASPTITVNDVLTILQELPVKELKSDGARIGFAAARFTIAIAGWSTVDAVRLEQLRPVVQALANGIADGGG